MPAAAIEDLSEVAKIFPQSAYCGLVKSLQHEWNFLLRAIPNIAENFTPLQQSMENFFLKNLFGHSLSKDHQHIQELISLPVKFSGLSIVNFVTSTTHHHDSMQLTSYLLDCLYHERDFNIADHSI